MSTLVLTADVSRPARRADRDEQNTHRRSSAPAIAPHALAIVINRGALPTHAELMRQFDELAAALLKEFA